MAHLLGCLDPINISWERLDMRKWTLVGNGRFTIHPCYGMLEEMEVPSSWYSIWGLKIPYMVLFSSSFVWVACKGKILTVDNLQRRGTVLPNVYSFFILTRNLLTIYSSIAYLWAFPRFLGRWICCGHFL